MATCRMVPLFAGQLRLSKLPYLDFAIYSWPFATPLRMAAIPRLSVLLFLVFPLALALLVNLRNFSIWSQHVKSRLEDNWPHATAQIAGVTERPVQKFSQISQSLVRLASLSSYFSMGISSEKTHFRILQSFHPEYSRGQITQ